VTGNQLFSSSESNSVYYILKAIQLLSSYHENNSLLEHLNSRELFSCSENDLEKVGKILSTRNLRRTVWHFLNYGASTSLIIQNRLEITEPTAYRYITDLKAFKFIVPAVGVRGGRGKRGPRVRVWMVPDAEFDQIREAKKLHMRLLSPKYVAGEKLGQIILEEFMEPRKLKEITGKEVWAVARENKIRGELSDIVFFAMNYLSDQGIKVWRLLFELRGVGSTAVGARLEEPAVGGLAGAHYQSFSPGLEYVWPYPRI